MQNAKCKTADFATENHLNVQPPFRSVEYAEYIPKRERKTSEMRSGKGSLKASKSEGVIQMIVSLPGIHFSW